MENCQPIWHQIDDKTYKKMLKYGIIRYDPNNDISNIKQIVIYTPTQHYGISVDIDSKTIHLNSIII